MRSCQRAVDEECRQDPAPPPPPPPCPPAACWEHLEAAGDSEPPSVERPNHVLPVINHTELITCLTVLVIRRAARSWQKS